MEVIRTEHLSKHYGPLLAVDDLNLSVKQGEIYGFLGPNGAGKSTTISLLLGLIRPTQGRALLFGEPVREDSFALKRRVGVVGEYQNIYGEMTAWEYLLFFARLYRVKEPRKRAGEVLAAVRLLDRRNELVGGYSKGMLQKLSLARTLLHAPDLLVLDEPASSLDPYGIREVREILKDLNEQGKTIFLSSHILSEVERTCHRVGILQKGRLVTQSDMAGLRRRLSPEMHINVEFAMPPPLEEAALNHLPWVKSARWETPVQLRVILSADQDHRSDLLRHLTEHGAVPLEFNSRQISLEEAFMEITESNLASLAASEGISYQQAGRGEGL